MQKQKQNRRGQSKIQLMTVTLDDGSKIKVDPVSLKGGWTKHSGTASDGTEVHSLNSRQIGKTTILQDSSGRSMAFNTADLEVAAKQLFGSKING